MAAQQTQHTPPEPDASGATAQFSPRTARQRFVKELAARLGETEYPILAQLGRVVWRLGRTQAYALYLETLEIEERGRAFALAGRWPKSSDSIQQSSNRK